MKSLPARVLFAAAGAAVAAISAPAFADSSSLSPPSSVFNLSVDANFAVSGTRTVPVGVSHSDSGPFCSKIQEVLLVDATNHVVYGRKQLGTPLCNFNTSDVTVSVTPWSDTTIATACIGKGGQTVSLIANLDTCMSPTSTSFNPGVLFTGQQNQCGKGQFTAVANIQCAATNVHGAVPISGDGAGGGPATGGNGAPNGPGSGPTYVPPQPTSHPGATLPPLGTGTVRPPVNFVRGQVPLKIDPQLVGKLTQIVIPAQAKASLDTDHTALGTAYAAYAAASNAFQTKYNACMNQSYTPAQQMATCAPSDSWLTCAQKLVASCDAAEQRAFDHARAALHLAALKVVADAQLLEQITR